MRVLLALIALALAVVPATADRTLKREAKKHLDAALALYGSSDYDGASVEFAKAYDIDPDPSLLYALAQAKRLGGHCDDAMPIYTRYLDTHPSEAQTAAARTGMQLCEDEQKAKAQAAKEQAAREQAAKAQAAKEQAARAQAALDGAAPGANETPWRPRPWYRNPLGGALAGGGLVGVGVGVGYLVASRSAQHRADAAVTRDEFLDAVGDTNRRRRIGVGALAVGVGLVTAAVLVYVLDRPHAPPVVTAGTDGAGTVYLGVGTAF